MMATMAEYIEREKTVKLLRSLGNREYRKEKGTIQDAIKMISYPEYTPTADVAPVVRCKDCKHSTLPSELTQRYGKPGTLTCHNMHAPSNRRNVGSNDFCSYGERKDGGDENV
nr:MAG TPA: hypothetical protein [Caudoviricetes sp.]